MKKTILIFPLMIILLLSSSYGFGPPSHGQMLFDACSDSSFESPRKTLCCDEEFDACITGMVAADATVFYYIQNFKVYESTHNWNVPTRCEEEALSGHPDSLATPEQERAFCIGMGLHSQQDSISHNLMVPDNIRKYRFVPEVPVHSGTESNMDDGNRALNPSLQMQLAGPLEDLPKFCGGAETILYRTVRRDLGFECLLLRDAVREGGTYQTVFLIGPVVQYGYRGYIWLSGFVPFRDWRPYYERGVAETVLYLKGSRTGLVPTGRVAIREAQGGWNVVKYGSILLLLFLAWRVGRRVGLLKFLGRRR